jgi:type II secretory pathway pseudopilin PulG
MVLVALALMALIGSAALVLLAGSVEWQKNQLQELADSAALDAALQIGIGCDSTKAHAVITAADTFLATRRTGAAGLTFTAGTCATPYLGQDTFAGGLAAKINYPYRAHQKQVEVILTLTLPISFGAEVGTTNTTVMRRAVAQALEGSVPAVSATDLTCASGQVNVAGSVRVQNQITIGGTCALYSHARYDAASGTYSDLGNTRVYADSQGWVGIGGSCTANSNSGSTKAICADGFEETGHATPTCGTAVTSAYLLSPGDATVNPNPCAAGLARPPVASVPTSLPPEPNLDPKAIATLQGTGGTACAAGTAYSTPIMVGPVTVGTGDAPAPVVDSSGFYHFKPSCYGYLNTGALTTGISNVQIGLETAVSRTTVTPTLPLASTPGTLLVADIRAESTNKAFTGPAGWILANGIDQPGATRGDIWYLPGNLNAGGIMSATFTLNSTTVDTVAQMTEWRNVVAASPLDRTGTATVNPNNTTAIISTSAATTVADELVITDTGFGFKAGQTIAQAVGWNSLLNDVTNGFTAEYRVDLPAAIATETLKSTVATRWSLVIATFKPAPSGIAPAVLDPGLYYFNGTAFPSGLCLNGDTLLAHDVTLEFVNKAGFSSGTCSAGGSPSCAVACQFGSPSSAPLDSPNNLTWFAAPCISSPNPGDASCLGAGSWCPPGDRSCSNLLIWAAPGSTGQIAITGAVAKAWLLGSIYWPGTCTYQANGASSIAGSLTCGTLTISAGAGSATAVGSDEGISTALVEAVLVE